MSLVSNTGTLTISGTALSAAAASMSSGQYLNFGASSGTTGLDLLQSGPGPSGVGNGASGIRTPYCSEFVYDQTNKIAYCHSGDHAQSAQLFRYNETTNSLVVDHIASWMVVASATAVHGYDHIVRDGSGVIWSRKIQEQVLKKWAGPGSTTWTNSTTIAGPGGSISAAGQCYHAALNKILVHQIGSGTNGILVGMDPVTQVWTTYSTTLSGTGDPHNFACYNPTSQLAWFGGGNNCLLSWQINASGTITAAAQNLPQETGPSNSAGLALPNPHNGDFTVWYDGNNWYDYAATTTRTFTKKVPQATAFLSNMASQNDVNAHLMSGVIGCSIGAPYNVFFFWKAWARLTPGEMWLYKP